MVGAVRGIDPETGEYFDDTKRYIDALTSIAAADKRKILEDNARKVYPRIGARLAGAEDARLKGSRSLSSEGARGFQPSDRRS
jgi:hypothetical protein